MTRLEGDYYLKSLLSKWCFFSLSDFIKQVRNLSFTKYDGIGQFVYIDDNFNLYTKSVDVIGICKNFDFNSIEQLQEEQSDEIYKLFGVLWFNK